MRRKKSITILATLFAIFTLTCLAGFRLRLQNPEYKIYFTINRRSGKNGSPYANLGLFVRNGRGVRHLGWSNAAANGVLVQEMGKVIYLACANGVMRSRDSGQSWKIVTDWQVRECLKVYAAPDSPACIYTCTAFGIWKSKDGGESWEEFNHGLGSPGSHYVERMYFGRNGNLFAATADGVFEHNYPKGWQNIGMQGVEIHDIIQSNDKPERLVCATGGKGIWYKDNGGKKWRQAKIKGDSLTFYCLNTYNSGKEYWYAGSYKKGIYVSTDFCKSWKTMMENNNEVTIYQIKNYETLYFTSAMNGLNVFKGWSNKNICISECDGNISDIYRLEE